VGDLYQVKWVRRFVSTLLKKVDGGVHNKLIICFEVSRQRELNRRIRDRVPKLTISTTAAPIS